MKISVITVCRNAVTTIERALLSLYGQTYQNIEHIVIDGVSTDGTLELLEKYKDKISVLVSESDTGIYNAMNKGIKHATGDIVYFLNATDCLYDTMVFEKAVAEFNKYPDLEFLWGDVQFVENNENVRIATFGNIKIKNDLIYNNPCHQSIFYKNDVFKRYGGYDESLPIYADCDYNLKILIEHDVKCKYIPEVLSKFELGGVSTSSDEKIRLRRKNEQKEIYKRYFSKNLDSVLDKFFTKTFGTITRAVKKTKSWDLTFNFLDKTSQIMLKKRLSLNLVKD